MNRTFYFHNQAPTKTVSSEAAPTTSKVETELVQFNIRLDPGLRDRVKDAAHEYCINEPELIEKFAATLREVSA